MHAVILRLFSIIISSIYFVHDIKIESLYSLKTAVFFISLMISQPSSVPLFVDEFFSPIELHTSMLRFPQYPARTAVLVDSVKCESPIEFSLR